MYLAGVRLSRILACLVFHLFRRWNYINIRFIWLPILYKIWNNIALKIYIWCVSQIHNNLFCQFSLSSILLPIHNKTQSIEPRKKKKTQSIELECWTKSLNIGEHGWSSNTIHHRILECWRSMVGHKILVWDVPFYFQENTSQYNCYVILNDSTYIRGRFNYLLLFK